MKTTALVVVMLVVACSTALCQNLPPSTIGSLNIRFNIQGGNGINLANSGTATGAFTSPGSFAFLDITGDVKSGQYGTYTYFVVNSTTARIVYHYLDAARPDQTTTLNFTNGLAGSYTAVAGAGTAFGAFSLGASDSFAPLVNISNLLQIGSAQTVSAGFVVGGPIPRRVLIRAIGPALRPFGIGDAIRATTMTVFSGNTVVARNSGWSSVTAQIQALNTAFSSTGAFPLVVGSADSAVILSLAPGAYSCSVGGQLSSDSGSVLIEVYYYPQ